MLDRVRNRLTYANVISSLALFLALSGGAYALTIPSNTIGSKQLKKNAVRASDIRANAVSSSKVKNLSLLAKDFKAGQLPAGAKGDKGATGDPGPFPGVLPSGKTIRGMFAIRAVANPDIQDSISFGFRLASAPTPHYIFFGTAPPPECPGTPAAPEAASGHLCAYESDPPINSTDRRVFDPVSGNDNQASPEGAGVAATATTDNQDTRIRGSWAVTSP